MKKQNLITLVRKSIFNVGFTSLLLIGISSVASAQEAPQATTPAIAYIGSLDGQPVFKVELDNKNSAVSYLTIKDELGDVLYSEKIRNKHFSKKFKFENSDRENLKLTFQLESAKGTVTQEFKVNTSTKVLSDVVVTKL